jgi:uridine phosphorylase
MSDSPLLEFDPDPSAFIEPAAVTGGTARVRGAPAAAVACFFQEVIAAECIGTGARVLATLTAEHGKHPIYVIEREGREIAVFHPGVGAPLAVGFLEEVLSLGVRTVVACGGAGVIHPGFDRSQVLLVSSAVRDEGTSYHYQPPSREMAADPAALACVGAVLEGRGVPFTTGKTWTTDALYRETRGRIARRVAEGCVTVEMEASAFLAVAAFCRVRFAQLLYGGDDVSGERWNSMRWRHNHSVRNRLFDVALDAALALAAME